MQTCSTMSKHEDFEVEFHRAFSNQEATRLDVVKECLRQKADPNQEFYQDEANVPSSPLQLALRHGDAELCRLLLLYQADTKAVLNDAATLSGEAAEVILNWVSEDYASILEVLEAAAVDAAKSHDVHSLGLALASLEVAGGDGENCVSKQRGSHGNLLHVCARNGGLAGLRGRPGGLSARATARALIGWGVDLQEAPSGGPRSFELARTLLEEGADPEQPGADQETLLMQAAREGDYQSCELLLEFQADPLRRRKDGQTAITLASHEEVPRQVLLTLRSALTRDLTDESIGNIEEAASRSASSRRSLGVFSRMTNHAEDTPMPKRRSTPGAFSKMQTSEELTPPLSDQAKSLSFAESECETRLGDDTDEAPSRAALFSMSDVDQEMYSSAEGLLNQVDLEEAYDDDWTAQANVTHFASDEPFVELGDGPLESKWSQLSEHKILEFFAMESERPRTNWKYKASDVTMGFSNLLSNYQRRPKPFRRSPHVVGQQNPASARYACDEMQGLLPAPNIEFEDDFDKVKQAPLPGPLGSGVATGVPCPGGKAARPDTCFMTHRYVKQEMAYLARRIDEVGRYFLALESMVGSGALGPVLERCLKELEEVLQATEKLEEVDEVQSFIDAAIRLGFSPSKYKPLQNRLSWLCHGRRHEELRAELSATKVAPSAEDALKLQQLIDDAVRSGIDAVEIQPARLRLQELEQQASNERMLAAACAGDLVAVEESLRFAKGDCNSQQTSFPGFSLWHIAAEQGNLALAQLAESFKSQTVLHDRSGWTALMLAASKHHFGLVRALLDAKADPSARSSDCEMIVDCETNEELRWVKGQLDETERVRCFFEIKQGDATATLDQGDQLLAGEGLLLPTFLRVGGRTALHTALLRPGYESGRIAVLNEILSDDRCGPAGVLVNVQDDIGRSPLWYAARECFVGCARCLIRAGALVSLDSMSSLGATVKFLSGAEDDASAMQRGEDMFRLLLRKGASDSMEEVAQAEAILDLDLSGCQLALDLHEALEEDDDAIERWLEYSQQLQEDYNLRLMTQRPHGKSMASAEEAADFAKDAQEELKELAFGAAHAFGGYVESGPEPSAVRISRLYRQQSRQGWIDPSHDWAAVVGGCEATLIFPKLGDVYQALAHLEQVYSFRIRGVQDNLLSGNSHFTHHDPGDSVTAQTSEGEASTATEELARDVAAKNLAPADVTEEVLFQASNDDRSLAASAAAKGLAAATDVALQQLMSPEELARDVAAKGLAAAADVAYHSLGVEAEEAHSTAAAVAAVGVAAATEVAVRRLSQDSAAKTDVARQLDPMEKVRDASRPSDLGLLAGWERGSLLQDTSIEFVDPVYPDVQLWIDCSGCVCLLRLTTERVHEVVQTELDTGRWILEELANAMRLSLLLPESEDDHEDEILEIMDAAEACLGREHLAQILAIPLQDGWSCTVAGLAAHCGFASILQILIDHGAPISQPLLPPSCAPRGDYSPLSLAIAAQHWDCVSLLVSSGADPFEEGVEELARNPSFPEAFQEKVLDVLTCGRAQRLVDNEALAAMVRSSSPPMQEIQRYLAFGADPNTEGMLHTAAAAGQEALVSILLDFGAQVCGETFDRATGSAKDVVCRRARARLHRAAEAHDVETMIRLVEAGLNPDSMLPARSSLLTYAAVGDGSSPHFDLVAVMLQQKADPNLMDLAGHYPLLCAVESGRPFWRSQIRMPSPEDPGHPMTAAATSVGGGTTGGEGGSFGFRDREPAPGYSGEDPETTFATWEKNVRLWEYETDIPRGKRGVKLLRALEGSAKMAVEEMPFEEIACEDGVRNIMQRLKEYYMPHLEVALPRAFEGAVYGPPRPSRESFGEYIAKMDKNFARLRKEGVDLPESAQGYILYRQASLSEFQEQRLLVWSDGKYDRMSIVKGLRKLDKVVKEKGKSNYLTNLPEDEAENFAEEHYLIADEEDDDNFIYLQEGDLDEILTEEEVLSALASYQDIRKAVKEQQKGRRYYGNGKGYGKDSGKSKSKGKGKWQRVHREQLKLRTKCWKCDQVGHWSSECKNEPKRHGPPSSGTSSSSVSTARSGFYVASGNVDGQVDERVLFSDQAESCLWLREFVAQRAKNTDRPIPESYKAAAPQFCGINTIAAHGVVDTAAEGGLVGTLALQRLQDHLRSYGLCCKWIPKNTAAKGVGGQAKVVGVTLIPLGIGGVNGVLEATVVEGDVPLLLPIRMMKGLRTVIDLDQMKFIMKEYEVTVDMFELPSGHVTVDITNFENGRLVKIQPARTVFASMELLKRVQALGSGPASQPMQMEGREFPERNKKKALRGWRVIMDKVCTLLLCSMYQSIVADWFPQSQPSQVSRLEGPKEEQSIEELYAEIILEARSLAPLKSQTTRPTAAASCCTHPKNRLRGGGNGAASYIVCRDCHSRWENPYRSAALRQGLKEQKGRQMRGLLGQAEEMQVEEMKSEGPVPALEDSAERAVLRMQQEMKEERRVLMEMREQMKKEAEQQRIAAREASLRQDALIRSILEKKEDKKENESEAGPPSAAGSVSAAAPGQVRCKCGEVAERLTVKKEGPRKGMKFYKCMMRDCDYFESEESKKESTAGCGGGGQRWALREERGGSWCEATNTRARRTLRRLQGERMRGVSSRGIQVDPGYEIEEKNRGWRREEGLVPLRSEFPIRVWVELTHRGQAEEIFGGDQTRGFKSKERKKVNRAMEALLSKEEIKKVVAEVFSPPRVVETAMRHGLAGGTSFDYETGWDLDRPDHRSSMCKKLKEEEPMMIILCPPCKAFTILQGLNFGKMDLKQSVALVSCGLDSLELAMEIAKWQWRRGRYFLFEHPESARSWEEPSVQEVVRLEGVEKGGQIREDGGWMRREGEGDKAVYVFAEEEEDEDLDLGLEEDEIPMRGEKAEEVRGEEDAALSIGRQEQQAVHKLHKGLGHPATGDLVRFMKAARVKDEIIKWTSKKFVCNQCESRPRPRTTRPASIPKAYQPNKVVGIDLIYVPNVGGNSLLPALSIVDYGSNYQMVQLIENKEPETVWRALWMSWIRTFGLPEVITCDAGKEFTAQFVQRATSHGVVVYQIGARAPWQNGRAERHGAHFKELLEKARSEIVLTNQEELKLLMQEVEAAKNRFSNRSGFSPVQRHIGQWPRCPSEILNKPTWVGPGTVVTVDGANLWITVWGELWKVAREQCRLATNSEKEGIELVLKECAELIDEYKKTSKRAGYKDLTEEPWPDLEEEDGEEAAEEVVKERGEKRKVRFQEDDDLYEPTTEEETDDRGDLEERRRASRESVQTREEPEGEDEMSRRTESMNSLPEATGPSIELEGPEEASRSVIPAGNPMQDPRYREAVREEEHVRKRKAKFNPEDSRDLPVRAEDLKEERRTILQFVDNRPAVEEEDVWRGHTSRKKSGAEWKGCTVFFFKEQEDEESKEARRILLAEKRRSDEVNMKKESARDLEEWRVADRAEWDKIAESGAVQVLTLEESRKVVNELKKHGKERRVLPTKIARRYKPSEQPGVPATKKSRLCLRGDLDPDILSLERFSPTVNTMNLAVMLQLAANENMCAQIGDLKNAFCQSSPLERKEGPLYFRQPSEGIDGLHPEQIVKIVAGCYGLVDAPLHWRKSLTEELKKLGYVQSHLDPCLYKLYHQGRLEGMIAIEVDDLFMTGHQVHLQRLELLKKRFVFGKFVTLKECPEGAMFNGRRIRQMEDGEFQIDMQKFVEERLSEVEDMQAMNEVVRNLKKNPALAVRVQPLRDMMLSVVSDASFGNDNLHSQGGQMIISHEKGLQENREVRANLLWWRSGRIHRVVNSTLAAETQSLSRGLGDLLWILVLVEELKQEDFSIREWPTRLSGKEVTAIASRSSSEGLKECLAIVDAKSLYDHLCKETIGGQDKRTAIEIQIIREDLNSLSGKIRWVDHPAMVADSLTKVKGSNESLYRMMQTGRFKLVAEEDHMEARNVAKNHGQTTNDIRRFGINKNELLAHGADVHVAHEELGTATHMAARSGQVHLLEVLLDAGARCSDCDSDGHDVAMLALKATAEDCVSCIRQRGVLPNHDLALAELFSAVRKGQSEYLEQLLDILVKIYPEIVNCTEDGKCEARSEFPSLLVEAVRQAGIKMMKSLLNAGARLYPQQVTEEPLSGMEHRESAWSIACAVSSELTVELLRNRLPQELLLIAKQHRSSSEMRNMQAEERLGLVAQEKDFLLVDEFGYGALDHALLKHNLELEIWFCSHGARFHQSGQLEVLSECVKTSDYVALERRLRAGADVSVVDLNGRVALDWCIFTGFFESLLWDCVENAMTNESDNEEGGATPSVSSKAATAKTGRSGRSAGRLSLRSRKTATATGGSGVAGRGRPPVPFDPRGNFAPIEELLISYGAKFLQTRSAAACLYEPLLLRDFKTIERRAFAAADCSVDGDAGEGMVHRALDGGGVQAARALILNGADPDVLDAHGQTVLWRAVQGDLHTIIDACLLQNIDLSQGLGKQKDSSVAHLAIEKDRPDLAIQFLTRTSPDTEEKIKPPCVNPDATDSHGRTVLMRAVELKHVDVAKVCLELKCNISLVDRLYRRTALHIAAESNPEMIPLLLEARADMNVTDKRGQTPLVAATASRQAESVDLLKKALLAAGPTPPKIPEQPKQKKKPEPAQLQEEREQEHPEPPRQPKQPKDPDLPKRPRQPEQQKEPEVAHLPAQQREQEQTQQPQQLEEQGADLSQMPEQHLKQEHTEHPEQPQQSEEPKQPDLSQLPEPQRKPEHAEHPEPPRQPKDLDLPKQPRQPEQQKEPEVAHLPAQQREQEHREHPAKVQQLEQQLQPDLSELPEQRQESEPIQPVLPEQPTAASDLSSQQEPGTAQPPSRETEEAQQAKEPEQLQEYSGESGEYEEDFEDASPDSSPRMFG
eukprot:symbB.v1.2.021909.t1/scaffold1920.1/size100294/3